MKVVSILGLIFGILLLLFGGGCILLIAAIWSATASEALLALLLGFLPAAFGLYLIAKNIRSQGGGEE